MVFVIANVVEWQEVKIDIVAHMESKGGKNPLVG